MDDGGGGNGGERRGGGRGGQRRGGSGGGQGRGSGGGKGRGSGGGKGRGSGGGKGRGGSGGGKGSGASGGGEGRGSGEGRGGRGVQKRAAGGERRRGGAPRSDEDRVQQLSGPLERILKRLPAAQREVLEWRMGLKDGHPHDLADTARQMGISLSEARDIEQRAFAYIREAVPVQQLQRFLPGSGQG